MLSFKPVPTPERQKSLFAFKGAKDAKPEPPPVVMIRKYPSSVRLSAMPSVPSSKAPVSSTSSLSSSPRGSTDGSGSMNASRTAASAKGASAPACVKRSTHSRDSSGSLSSLSSISSTRSVSAAAVPSKRKLESGDASTEYGRAVTPVCNDGNASNHASSTSSSPLSSAPASDAADSPRSAAGLFAEYTTSSESQSKTRTSLTAALAPQRAQSSPAAEFPTYSTKPVPYKRAKTTPASASLPRSAKIKRAKTPLYEDDADDDERSDGGPAKIRKKRRGKRLTDTTLPPLKGTFSSDAPVMLRSEANSRATSDSEFCGLLKTFASKERKTWAEEDGNVRDRLQMSRHVIETLSKINRYVTYFKNPHDPSDSTFELENLPVCSLEYPASSAQEQFVLARPRDKDHYDPTLDIENTLTTLVKDFIPAEYKNIFGPLPEDEYRNCVDDDDAPNGGPKRPAFTIASTIASSPFLGSSSLCDPTYCSDTPSCPPTSSPQHSSPASRGTSASQKGPMQALSSARHCADGPAYLSALEKINDGIRALKNDPVHGNILAQVPRTWAANGTGIPEEVVHRIVEETYQRCIGPKINILKKYEAFSSNVYGELTPQFVSNIVSLTGLHSECLFLDLGSGVGNVVLQAALQTGCSAYGIEEREDTAGLAKEQLEQLQLRCRMWGVSMGKVELEKGDMTKSRRVDELMSKADVVLVNNYVFSEELNASLRPKFLDLKEGAIVISLKPFARPTSSSVLLTERNFDDISAIFDVTAHRYREGTVSWSGGGGMFYAHQVNRDGYRCSRENFEKRRMNRRRRGGGA